MPFLLLTFIAILLALPRLGVAGPVEPIPPEVFAENAAHISELIHQAAANDKMDLHKLEKKYLHFWADVLAPLLGPGVILLQISKPLHVAQPAEIFTLENLREVKVFYGSVYLVKQAELGFGPISNVNYPTTTFPTNSMGTTNRLGIPTRWNWNSANIVEFLLPQIQKWLPPDTPIRRRLRLYYDALAPNMALVAEVLPFRKLSKAGIVPSSIAAETPSVDLSIEGALSFDALAHDQRILHPVIGNAKVVRANLETGELTLLPGLRSHDRMHLIDQRGLRFALQGSPAAKRLSEARMKKLYRLDSMALLAALNIIQKRASLRYDFYNELAQAGGVFANHEFGNLSRFLETTRVRLQDRGVGADHDTSDLCRVMAQLANVVHEETHEDIVRSGVLTSLAEADQGEFRAVTFFSDQFRGGGNGPLWLETQLRDIPVDVGHTLRELLWKSGNGALTGRRAPSGNLDNETMAPYYSYSDPRHDQDAFSQWLTLLHDFPTVEFAMEAINLVEERLRAAIDDGDYDIVTYAPAHKATGAAKLLVEVMGMYGVISPEKINFLISHRDAGGRAQSSAATLQERLMNQANRFSLKSTIDEELVGKKILLVDDVMASAISAEEFRRILLDAGAHKVRVIAFGRSARGDKEKKLPRNRQNAYQLPALVQKYEASKKRQQALKAISDSYWPMRMGEVFSHTTAAKNAAFIRGLKRLDPLSTVTYGLGPLQDYAPDELSIRHTLGSFWPMTAVEAVRFAYEVQHGSQLSALSSYLHFRSQLIRASATSAAATAEFFAKEDLPGATALVNHVALADPYVDDTPDVDVSDPIGFLGALDAMDLTGKDNAVRALLRRILPLARQDLSMVEKITDHIRAAYWQRTAGSRRAIDLVLVSKLLTSRQAITLILELFARNPAEKLTSYDYTIRNLANTLHTVITRRGIPKEDRQELRQQVLTTLNSLSVTFLARPEDESLLEFKLYARQRQINRLVAELSDGADDTKICGNSFDRKNSR